MENKLALRKRIYGLDSIRFFAALCVVMTHCGSPPLMEGADVSNKLIWALNGFYSGSISGPAAVILFFIISGFCIHYPFQAGFQNFDTRSFLIRRITRVLLPMLVALVTVRLLKTHDNESDWLSGVPAWSLIAEIIYYLLYPFLSKLSKVFQWKKICVAAFIVAFTLSLTVPISNLNYTLTAGPYLSSWILGLPCWLLGVVLAEKIVTDDQVIVTAQRIWCYRTIGFFLGAVSHNLALQLIIGQHITLNLFAFYAYFWLRSEIYYYSAVKPIAIFESAGKWSYSLYLMHLCIDHLFNNAPIPFTGYCLDWILKITTVCFFSIIFYKIIELPSYYLARKWSRN